MAIKFTGVALKRYVEAIRAQEMLSPTICDALLKAHAEDIKDAKQEAREDACQQIESKMADLRKERISL